MNNIIYIVLMIVVVDIKLKMNNVYKKQLVQEQK